MLDSCQERWILPSGSLLIQMRTASSYMAFLCIFEIHSGVFFCQGQFVAWNHSFSSLKHCLNQETWFTNFPVSEKDLPFFLPSPTEDWTKAEKNSQTNESEFDFLVFLTFSGRTKSLKRSKLFKISMTLGVSRNVDIFNPTFPISSFVQIYLGSTCWVPRWTCT